MAKKDGRSTASKLTMKQQFTVAQELAKMTEDLTSGKFTVDDFAERLSKKLDFKMTGANVKAVIESAGIPFKNKNSERSTGGGTFMVQIFARLDALESEGIKAATKIHELETKINQLLP